jgi:hypothetical protein
MNRLNPGVRIVRANSVNVEFPGAEESTGSGAGHGDRFWIAQ